MKAELPVRMTTKTFRVYGIHANASDAAFNRQVDEFVTFGDMPLREAVSATEGLLDPESVADVEVYVEVHPERPIGWELEDDVVMEAVHQAVIQQLENSLISKNYNVLLKVGTLWIGHSEEYTLEPAGYAIVEARK